MMQYILKKRLSIEGLIIAACISFYPISIITRYYFFYIALVLCTTIYLIEMSVRSQEPFNIINKFTVPFFIFFLLVAVSILYAHYESESLFRVSIVFPLIILYILSYKAVKKGDISWINSITLIFPIITMSIFFYSIINFGSVRGGWDRYGSFPNTGSTMTVILIPFILFKIRTEGLNIFSAISMILSLGICALSGSRSALITSILTLTMLPFLMDRNKSIKKIIFLLKLIILSSIIIVLLNVFLPIVDTLYSSINRLASLATGENMQMFNDTVKVNDDYGRNVMYYEGLKLIKENIILGIGFGGLSAHIAAMYRFSVVSHNWIITAWGEVGLAGLLCITWIFTITIQSLIRLRKTQSHLKTGVFTSCILLSVAMIIFQGLFRPLFTNPLFYVVFGMAAGQLTRGERETGQLVQPRLKAK